jgi:hypothetical protein
MRAWQSLPDLAESETTPYLQVSITEKGRLSTKSVASEDQEYDFYRHKFFSFNLHDLKKLVSFDVNLEFVFKSPEERAAIVRQAIIDKIGCSSIPYPVTIAGNQKNQYYRDEDEGIISQVAGRGASDYIIYAMEIADPFNREEMREVTANKPLDEAWFDETFQKGIEKLVDYYNFLLKKLAQEEVLREIYHLNASQAFRCISREISEFVKSLEILQAETDLANFFYYLKNIDIKMPPLLQKKESLSFYSSFMDKVLEYQSILQNLQSSLVDITSQKSQAVNNEIDEVANLVKTLEAWRQHPLSRHLFMVFPQGAFDLFPHRASNRGIQEMVTGFIDSRNAEDFFFFLKRMVAIHQQGAAFPNYFLKALVLVNQGAMGSSPLTAQTVRELFVNDPNSEELAFASVYYEFLKVIGDKLRDIGDDSNKKELQSFFSPHQESLATMTDLMTDFFNRSLASQDEKDGEEAQEDEEEAQKDGGKSSLSDKLKVLQAKFR